MIGQEHTYFHMSPQNRDTGYDFRWDSTEIDDASIDDDDGPALIDDEMHALSDESDDFDGMEDGTWDASIDDDGAALIDEDSIDESDEFAGMEDGVWECCCRFHYAQAQLWDDGVELEDVD
jgi:hypothetical protein